MSWQSYNLDQAAHDLVLKYRDKSDALNQAFKMRMTVSYGLERFWGEQLRLQRQHSDRNKAAYWGDTWKALVKIMSNAGVNLPNGEVDSRDTKAVQNMSEQLWEFNQEQRKVAIAVLTQLTEAMVWWTQRYKK